MYGNFLRQVVCADELGYGTAWIAESHLSSEVQKRHEHPPPHFDDPLWKICGTRTDDTARAIQLALESTAKGYYALLISGDTTGEYIRTDRARNLLGWTPTPWDGP